MKKYYNIKIKNIYMYYNKYYNIKIKIYKCYKRRQKEIQWEM